MESFGPYSQAQTAEAAAFVLRKSEGSSVLCFSGEPGAGKTTLIKEICMQLGVADNTSSPTFSLVNVYLTATGRHIYHMDAYRLKSAEEALDFGAGEYIRSGDLCLIEWPDVIADILPADALQFHIEAPQPENRLISIKE